MQAHGFLVQKNCSTQSHAQRYPLRNCTTSEIASQANLWLYMPGDYTDVGPMWLTGPFSFTGCAAEKIGQPRFRTGLILVAGQATVADPGTDRRLSLAHSPHKTLISLRKGCHWLIWEI